MLHKGAIKTAILKVFHPYVPLTWLNHYAFSPSTFPLKRIAFNKRGPLQWLRELKLGLPCALLSLVLPGFPGSSWFPRNSTPPGNRKVLFLHDLHQRSRKGPSKGGSFYRTKGRKPLGSLSYFRVKMRSQDVPFCERLNKRPRENLPLASSWKYSHAVRESLLALCAVAKRLSWQGRSAGSRQGETVLSLLSYLGWCLLSPYGENLLIGKGRTLIFQLLAIPGPLLFFWLNWNCPDFCLLLVNRPIHRN